MKLQHIGKAPDYRFTLANERTFLAWIRTALGFLVTGVALDQFFPDIGTPAIRHGLSLIFYLTSGGLAIYGYWRWLQNERAMRLNIDLRYTNFLMLIGGAVLAINLAVAWIMFHG